MQERSRHLSDEEILQFIDRELPSRRQLRVGAHLAECPSCRSRRAEFEGTSAEFSDIYESTINSQHQTSLDSRSMLKDRITESVARGHRGWPSRIFLHVISRQLVCAERRFADRRGGWLRPSARLRTTEWIDAQETSRRSLFRGEHSLQELAGGSVSPTYANETISTTILPLIPPCNRPYFGSMASRVHLKMPTSSTISFRQHSAARSTSRICGPSLIRRRGTRA